jgi:hypothetical protein
VADGDISAENIRAQLKRVQAGEYALKDVRGIVFVDRDCSLEVPTTKKQARHTEL